MKKCSLCKFVGILFSKMRISLILSIFAGHLRYQEMFFGKFVFNFKVRVLDLNLVDAPDEQTDVDFDI